MKLKAPDGTTGELHLHGRTFDIDKKGQVDIPDDCISSKLWSDGYTVAPEKTEVVIPATPINTEKKEGK